MKKFFLLAGLPRSGSTLLGAILSQNKNIHVSGTSGLLGILTNMRAHWRESAELKALGDLSELRKAEALRGVLSGFYKDIDRPVVIDKCRTWPAQLELAESLFQDKPKVIVTVRDVRDVLASFERLWRARKSENILTDQERLTPAEYQSCNGRCNVLMSPTGVIGGPIGAICDAVVRGWRRQMLFVEYYDLCENPADTLRKIYKFLELDPERHDFQNVSQLKENDEHYGWGDLHSIRPEVRPSRSNWVGVIPERIAMLYEHDAFFWRTLGSDDGSGLR